jgi:hypothetical protein
MTLDTSGNIGSITFDQVGVNMTSVGANAIANSRTRAVATVSPVGGFAVSQSCGSATVVATTFVNVPNLAVTLVTSGRPVVVQLIPDLTSSVAQFLSANSNILFIQIVNTSTSVTIASVDVSLNIAIPGSLSTVDYSVAGTPGTYNYNVYFRTNGGGTCAINFVRLIAYEI